MSDQEEKTEDASPRKLEEMRDKGQGVRSADVSSAVALAAAAGALAMIGGNLVQEMMHLTARCLRLGDVHDPLEALHASSRALIYGAVPLLAVSVLCAAVGVAQGRVFSLKILMFDFDRIDPAKHIQQLLPGPTQLLEILKQVLKLGAIGWVAYRLIAEAMPMFSVLGQTPAATGANYVAGVAGKLYMRVAIAFAVVAAFDYWVVHRKFSQDSKMSKDEAKQERKGEEASPELRMRIRRKMRELMRARSFSDVSKATVVVTNPTHYAVALRYLPDQDFAPIILAKAIDDSALVMRTRARQHQIPIVENKPLARALFAHGSVGKPIPVDLYRATAEVIAFVIQLGKRLGPLAPQAQPEPEAEPESDAQRQAEAQRQADAEPGISAEPAAGADA